MKLPEIFIVNFIGRFCGCRYVSGLGNTGSHPIINMTQLMTSTIPETETRESFENFIIDRRGLRLIKFTIKISGFSERGWDIIDFKECC